MSVYYFGFIRDSKYLDDEEYAKCKKNLSCRYTMKRFLRYSGYTKEFLIKFSERLPDRELRSWALGAIRLDTKSKIRSQFYYELFKHENGFKLSALTSKIFQVVARRAMPVLLVGSTGSLGHAFYMQLRDMGFTVVTVTRADLGDDPQGSLEDIFDECRPHYVINCAADTNVRACENGDEEYKEAAHASNVQLPGLLAALCKIHDATLVHFSTDYVFSGKKNSPYLETDVVEPINEYGRSKLLSEEEVQRKCHKYFIFRVSWLFGPYDNKGLIPRMMKALYFDRQGAPAVTGIWSTLTYIPDVVDMVSQLIVDTYEAENYTPPLPYGTYHYSTSDPLTP